MRNPSPPLVSQLWLMLAIASIALAAAAALALVLARTPLLTALVAADAFPRALVVHVNFATLIWYSAMACALWTERLPAARTGAAAIGLALGVAGALGVAYSGLAGIGSPVLANYIPYLDSPLFVASLACGAVGALGTALLSLQRPRDAAEWGFVLARWPFLMAAIYLVLRVRDGAPLVEAVWGTGHVLQFGYVTLLMAIWLRMAERAGGVPLPAPWAIALFAAAAFPASAAPLFYAVGVLDGSVLYAFHTSLMRWANWPAPLLFGLLLLGRTAARQDAGLRASVALLAVGCVAGVAIDSQTTMIPAHYHGTIGAFALALMAATLARVSPPGERTFGRLPLAMYAAGSFVLIAGLAWSGLLGAPRKSAFSTDGAELGATVSAALTGFGGLITVSAVALFVIAVIPGVFRSCKPQPHSNSRDGDAPTFAAAR